MKTIQFQITLFIWIIICGCSSSHVIMAWKAQHYSPSEYDNILVAGVIKNEDTSFRRKIEQHFVNDLKELNYKASSALNEFGPKGLANLGEEATYLKLCNKGIDAVITIALINEGKEISGKSYNGSGYPAKYYYSRIWNYKNMQNEFKDEYSGQDNFYWEVILFDLVTLEPQSTIQTKPVSVITVKTKSNELLTSVIQKMLREKILKKKENGPATQLKAF